MANNSVNLKDFYPELRKIVEQYGKELKDEMDVQFKEAAEQLKEIVNSTAPRSNRHSEIHLRGSFDVTQKTKKGSKIWVVWSPKDYQLVHLVEYGHVQYLTGHFVQPQPFFIPAYDQVKGPLVDKIKETIKQGGK